MSEIAKHWIDGEWTGSDTVSESINPATGAVLGRWADGGEAEARAAVAAARRAFDTSPWSRVRSPGHAPGYPQVYPLSVDRSRKYR